MLRHAWLEVIQKKNPSLNAREKLNNLFIYNHVNGDGQIGSYHEENGRTLPHSEPKLRRARVVLWWGTTWEGRVFYLFFLNECMSSKFSKQRAWPRVRGNQVLQFTAHSCDCQNSIWVLCPADTAANAAMGLHRTPFLHSRKKQKGHCVFILCLFYLFFPV